MGRDGEIYPYLDAFFLGQLEAFGPAKDITEGIP